MCLHDFFTLHKLNRSKNIFFELTKLYLIFVKEMGINGHYIVREIGAELLFWVEILLRHEFCVSVCNFFNRMKIFLQHEI